MTSCFVDSPSSFDSPFTIPKSTRRQVDGSWLDATRYRRGRSDDSKENPTTVLIYVDPLREQAREQVIRILEHLRLRTVAVEIREAGVQGPAQVGTSMGIAGFPNTSSTVGALIQLKWAGDKEWKTFGLACCHCVLLPEETEDRLYQATIQSMYHLAGKLQKEITSGTNDIRYRELSGLVHEGLISSLSNRDRSA